VPKSKSCYLLLSKKFELCGGVVCVDRGMY